AVWTKRVNEYRTLYENPYHAAERGYVDDVIMPSETRRYINAALDVLENKKVVRPWRKYSNITL
ncbi:MAG: carboxyl transferase domain-containing protein, partial [Bacillota bacterium]